MKTPVPVRELSTESERSYDVAPDGSRFVFARRQGGDEGGAEIFVVLDWYAELERLVPLGN